MAVGLFVVYFLGLFTLGTTAVRLAQSVRYRQMDSFLEKRENLIVFSVWSVVEANTALICANLPALSSLFKWAFTRSKSRVTLTKGTVMKNYSSSASTGTEPFAGDFGKNSFGVLCTTEFTADIERNPSPAPSEYVHNFPSPPQGYV